jgi:hypothetical protein
MSFFQYRFIREVIMATYSKYVLSGSTNGLPVVVLATGLVGTTIHTAPTGTTGMDEVYLWAANTATTDRFITLTVGTGTTATDNKTISSFTVPALDGLYQILPGVPYYKEQVVKCYATATDGVVSITGYANRIAT